MVEVIRDKVGDPRKEGYFRIRDNGRISGDEVRRIEDVYGINPYAVAEQVVDREESGRPENRVIDKTPNTVTSLVRGLKELVAERMVVHIPLRLHR